MSTRSDDEKKLRDLDADRYDDWYLERGNNAVQVEDQTIIKFLDFSINEKQNFLDLGCGTGRLTEKIAHQYPNLDMYGLDISEKSIDIVKNKTFDIEAEVFDASSDSIASLGYPKFDRILSMQMIQHLEDAGAINAINEIHHSLSPEGHAVIELYNYGGLNRVIERIRSRGGIKKIQMENLFYEHRYTANEFRDFAISNSDFKDVKLFGCQNIHRKIINNVHSFISLDKFLSEWEVSKFLGYYFIAVLTR